MKKFYKIALLTIVLVFLSTFNPKEIDLNLEKKTAFFDIKNIKIENNNLINTSEIKNKLNSIYGKNIIFIGRDDIEKPLVKTNFLEKIQVKKIYPNTIIIKIFETKPLAVLFKNKNKYLLDNLSNLISTEDYYDYNSLPNIFGEGAENNFVKFYKELKKYNFPIGTIKNYYYFQIGRWDLELLNKKLIKFPHKKTKSAIIKSIELLNHNDFKKYNIIDLRVDGKIIVE